MIYDMIQHGYLYGLCALSALILLTGEGRMKRTVLVMLAVMLASFGLSDLWPSQPYAWAMIAVDAAALIAICWRPAGKWQSLVGVSYLMQVTIHFGRIIAGDPSDAIGYWWGLSAVAIVQLLLLGGWWGAQYLIPSSRSDYDKAFAYPNHAGLAR